MKLTIPSAHEKAVKEYVTTAVEIGLSLASAMALLNCCVCRAVIIAFGSTWEITIKRIE